MSAVLSRIGAFVSALTLTTACFAATFGTVVPMHGTVSDIALDERHGRLYAANFGAYRVEVVNTATKALLAPINVTAPPSAVAVSPDNRWLVIGEYQKPVGTLDGGFVTNSGGLTIVDLDANTRRHLDFTAPVLVVAFGADGKALVVTRTVVVADNAPPQPDVFVLDPLAGTLQAIATIPLQSRDLAPTDAPVLVSTFPGQIIQAGVGVSGDRNAITILAGVEQDTSASSSKTQLIHYFASTHQVTAGLYTSAPPLGPRVVSVDQTGTASVDAWSLDHFVTGQTYQWAQFPAAEGAFNIGSHAWDLKRNLIYAQVPAPADGAVLHILDTDNLTVRERIQIPENLAGKSVMSSDMNTMYSASISGVTIFPMGQLATTPQVGSLDEDLLFMADSCNRLVLTQTLNLGCSAFGCPLGSAPADFTLSLPTGTAGVTLSTKTGTTPGQVQITIDPAVFQNAKGTTSINLNITSANGVNLPIPVRLLINTRDFNQRGQIMNVPGKLVDMLADPVRARFYLLRQDRNQVLVYEMSTLNKIGELRTGNTPVHMAMTTDSRYMIVGNDNSQLASVLDLTLLQSSDPILFPGGHYPRAIGVSNTGIFALIRPAGGPPACTTVVPPAMIDQINFGARRADSPCTLNGASDPSIFANKLPTPDGVFAASPDNNFLLLALASGDVAEYDSSAQAWVASRNDKNTELGAYGVLTNGLFLSGSSLLDAALVPVATLPATEGTPSGTALLQGFGLRTTASAPDGAGLIERVDLTNLNTLNATALAEAPVTETSLQYPPIGQIGETILSFTRSLAVSPDQAVIYALTTSGLTILSSNFDQAQPAPVITSAVNTADGGSGLALGGALSIDGTSLAPRSVSAIGYPLPSALGDVCATLNSIALPLFRVSPTEIVAQIPFNVIGSGSLIVKAPGGISAPFTLQVQATAPAIFHTGAAGDQSGLPAVLHDDGQAVTFSTPVHPNEELTIYLTGLGLTTPLPGLGQAAPAGAVVNAPTTVTLGPNNLPVVSATLTPGLATVYQIKVRTPGNLQPNRGVPLIITSGGVSTTLNDVRVVNP